MIPFGKKVKYTTRKSHGPYPSGTECIAWREYCGFYSNVLNLEFGGHIIPLDGNKYFLEGIEAKPSSWEEMMAEEIATQIDEEILGMKFGVQKD